jgi:accessory gene regulator protein AgrB
MRTVKFIAYLFYKYYSKGYTKQIAYFSTLCALVMIACIHLFQVFILCNALFIVPTDGSQKDIKNWFFIGLFLIPFFLIFRFLIKETELQEMFYDKHKVKRGYLFLIVYLILSFALLIFLALLKAK